MSDAARIESLRAEWARREWQHTGGLGRFKHAFGTPTVLTEGTKDMAVLFDCFWLFDIIGSAQLVPLKGHDRHTTQVWHVNVSFPSARTQVWLQPPGLTETEARGLLETAPATLGFLEILSSSSFPLEHQTLMVEWCDVLHKYVIMLPSER